MSVGESLSAIITNLRSRQQHIFSLLETCNSINQITQIHAQILINGFSHKNYFIAKLNFCYITHGCFRNACKVFDELQSPPSTTVWNQMIRGYAKSETPQKSVHLYLRMVNQGSVPDEYTYSYLVSACARSSMLREGEQLHGKVISNGYCSNCFIGTSLINLYLCLGVNVGLRNAYKVFDEMPGMERENPVTWNSLLAGHIKCCDFSGALRVFDAMTVKNIVSWTTMLKGCAQNGWFRHALVLFLEMWRVGLKLDQASVVVALSVCAELGDLGIGRWIHLYIYKVLECTPQGVSVRIHNALIHMYASCGLVEEAFRIFDIIPRRTVVSWTTMIMGYAKHGFAKDALKVFERMKTLGDVRPDARTFLAVLSACSHGGYVEEGRQCFKEMDEYWGISPSVEHYGCLVDLLSRAGLLLEACRLIETMPLKPNDVVWGALLSGCMIHRDLDIASYAAQKLTMVLDQEDFANYLVLLSSVCAMDNRWSEVAIVRTKITEMSSKSNKGKSWVQTNEAVQEFMAGDTNHRYASAIYEMLDQLRREVRFKAIDHGMCSLFKVL